MGTFLMSMEMAVPSMTRPQGVTLLLCREKFQATRRGAASDKAEIQPQSASRKGRKDHKCDGGRPNNGNLDFILGIFTCVDEGAAHFSPPDRKLDESVPAH